MMPRSSPMPGSHALLSASSSERWMHCPPSALLCDGIADEESRFAAEGTDAHALCEFRLKSALGMRCEDPVPGLGFHDQEMEDCAADYAAFAMEAVQEMRSAGSEPAVMVEQRLDFSEFVPGGFGTGDCVIVGDGELRVIDFKYGKGVPVEAEGNSQMRLYALGACGLLGQLYDIRSISMTIFQPRLGNVSTSVMDRGELYRWAADALRPAALLAQKGEGEMRAGAWCRFCKARAMCRERARANMELAAYEFREPGLLDDAEIADVLGRAGELASWAEDVKAHALAEALRGTRYPGFKLVEGRSVRKYSSDEAAAAAVEKAGYDPWQRSVLGVTAMTALLGRARFSEILGKLITKPAGRPALVPDSDRRPEMTMNDFEGMEE